MRSSSKQRAEAGIVFPKNGQQSRRPPPWAAGPVDELREGAGFANAIDPLLHVILQCAVPHAIKPSPHRRLPYRVDDDDRPEPGLWVSGQGRLGWEPYDDRRHDSHG